MTSAATTGLAERVERTLEENKHAVSESERRSAARSDTARRSNVVLERARRRLKRAGLLK
jgi:hypothetical protein